MFGLTQAGIFGTVCFFSWQTFKLHKCLTDDLSNFGDVEKCKLGVYRVIQFEVYTYFFKPA